MKTSNITQKDYQQLVLSCITEDYEGNELTETKEKISFCFEAFSVEYGWAIDRYGRQEAIKQWLMGLPTVCTVPFSNFDIVQWAENLLETKITEKDEQKLLHCYKVGYWNRCAQALNILFKKV